MTAGVTDGYYRKVPASRSGAWRWIVAGATLCCAFIVRPPAALSASASFEVKDEAVVQVIGQAATITIRTWNRHTVQVDWPDSGDFEPSRSTLKTRSSILIPTLTVNEYDTPGGVVTATLLPEDFPVPNLTPGLHDVVRVKEQPADGDHPPSELTVTIPASTGLVNVRSLRGTIVLRDYHGTTIAAIAHGRIIMRNVSGDAFIQPLNGRFYALDSDFDRLRIRSNHADEVFDACSVKQIEATTLTGNILFDNGIFNLGLARFESDRGSIALGVNGGAQLGAHTQDGRVLTVLPANASPVAEFGSAESPDGLQLVGNGGPLVNASSVHGNVFLYAGSLTSHRPAPLSTEWRPIYELLAAARETVRHSARPHSRN